MSEPKPFIFEAGGEAKRFAPATMRNRDAITDVLRGILPDAGNILEIASGTGEHIVHFARHFPQAIFQPSDPDPLALASIDAWREEAKQRNILPALQIDAGRADWPVAAADAILCINMVHIAPWQACIGLMQGAGDILPAGGTLYLYGPFREADRPLSPSNTDFDASLKSRNPGWGLRLVDDVRMLAERCGMVMEKRTEMPANNLSLVFRKTGA